MHHIFTLLTLAQVDAEDIDKAKAEAQKWSHWLMNDPVGFKVTLGVGIALALLVFYLILKRIKVAKNVQHVMIAACVIGGLLWASSFFGLEAGGWWSMGIMLVLLFTAFFILYSKISGD